jgi:hypothetical protein
LITANYSGDGVNFNNSTSAALTQTVNASSAAANTTTTVSSSANPSLPGQSVTFTATVTSTSTVNTGTVQFAINGLNFGSPVNVVNGTAASGATATLSPGLQLITANYQDGTSFNSSSGSLTQTVTNTSTSVASSVNPSLPGEPVTFTATITGPGGFPVPTGTVQFVIDGMNFDVPMPVVNGMAMLNFVSTLSVGTHTITANYSGDGVSFFDSTGSLTQTVSNTAAANTTTTVSSSANPSSVGQPVTFTAAVTSTSTVNTGTVQFVVDGTNFGSPVNVVNGTASSAANTTLSAGTHTITANYNGGTGFNSSTGSLTQTVSGRGANTTTTVNSSANPSASGQSVSFTATVTSTSQVNTGVVQFLIDGVNFGGSVGVQRGMTMFPITTTLSTGTHTITANYIGDGVSFNSSTGSLTQTVNSPGANTTTSVSSAANPAVFGQPLTFAANVTSTTIVNTGTVQFVIDGTNFGSPVNVTGGTASSGATTTLAVGTHTVAANFSDGTSFNSSTGSLTQTVTVADTTTSVSSSANPSVSGQPLTIIATVTAVSPSSATVNTGQVQFVINGVFLGPVPVVNGMATVPTGRLILNLGTNTIAANYSDSSGSYNTSTGSLTQIVVASANTTTTISPNINPAVFPGVVMFTATVTSTSTVNAGTVQFVIDGTNFGSLVNVTGGTATSGFTTTMSGGTHTITALYSGDGVSLTGSIGTVTQTVNAANTTIAVTSSANPSEFGGAVTFTATLNALKLGTGTATGTVTFLDSGTSIGSGALSGGSATFATSSLAAGSHTITASYSGDNNFSASTSAAITQTVNTTAVADTTTTVSSSANPSASGQTVTFTATVTPVAPATGTPTGAVTFLDGGASIGSGTLSGGSATFITSSLSVATHTITVNYGGDANFNISTSANLLQTVNAAMGGTTTTVSSSANPSAFGQSVTFTATVSAVAPATGTPTGTVTFLDGGASVGSGTLSGGSATFATSSLTVATHTITVSYGGDANFNTSTSADLLQTVNSAGFPTTTTVSSSANPSIYGQSVTFTASIRAPLGDGNAGTVQFLIDGVNFGSPVPVDPKAFTAASGATSTLTIGIHTITANYSGVPGTLAPSTGSLSQTVNAAVAATTTTVSSSANPSAFGQSVTFTATVSAVAPATGTPTGTVTFLDGGASIGSGTLSGGSATFATSSLSVATHTITVNYGGDANFTTSTSANLLQTVNTAGTPTFTFVNSSINPSVSGQSVTFTAFIRAPFAGPNLGTVQFLIDGVNFGSPVPVSLGNFSATSGATSTLAIGTHTITANYSGVAGTFAPSTGSLTQTVNAGAANTTTTVSSSANPSAFGQSMTFTATVTSTSTVNTGFVQFQIDGVNFLKVVNVVNGTATSFPTSSIGTLSSGMHTITANYIGDGISFNSSTGSLTQTVNAAPASTMTTVSSSASPSVYGQAVSFTATVTSTSTVNAGTVQFLIDGVNFGTPVTVVGGTATSDSTSTLAAGSHTITVDYTDDTTFTGSSGSMTQTVNPTTLTITANSTSKTYGDTVTFAGTEFTTSGLVNGDTVTSVTLTSSGAAATATVGSYDITPSAAVGTGLTNYTISYVNGTLTVSPTALTITANSTNKTYGDLVTFAGTEFTTSGLVNGDTVTSVTLSSSGAAATATVGSYPITPSAAVGTGLSNYTISYVNGTLAVTPKALTITANSTSKTYGDTVAFAGTEFTTSGLVNSDTVTSVTLASSGAAATAAVGSYAITPSAAVGTGLNNYTISYVNGALTVTLKVLTITANSTSKTYGDTVTFAGTEFTMSGLVNSDTVTTATLTSSGAAATATVGSYPITPSAAVGTGGLSNYTISYVNGTLTVTPKVLTITANSTSKTYGDTVTFAGTEFTSSGLVNSDTATSVTLSSSGAAATATVGSYAITPSAAVGTGLNNYTISYVNGTLTVTPKALTITANSTSKTYGDTVTFAGTEFTSSGLVNSDTVTSVSLASSGRAATATVGSYPITPSAAVGTGLSNYTISYVNGTLTVTSKALTITANSTSKTYGDTVTFAGTEFTSSGLVNGNTVTIVTLASSGAAATAAVGSYPITPSAAVGTGLNNYSISYVNGTLTVNQSNSSTKVTSSMNASLFGQMVTFTATVSAVAPGAGTPTGTVMFLDGSVSIGSGTLSGGSATFSTSALAVGMHTITVNYAGDANFTGSTSAAITQTVNQSTSSTTTSLASSANPSDYGVSVTFTATVTASAAGRPTGTVSFYNGTTLLAAPTLPSSGPNQVTCTTAALPAGSDSISAVYSGDAHFLTSTGTLVETVLSAQEQTTLLIGQITNLVNSGVLNSGQGNALTSKLNNAITNLNAGNTTTAINELNAFINQVNAFLNAGKLTTAQAQALIGAANQIIASASGGTGAHLMNDSSTSTSTGDTVPVTQAYQLVMGATGVYFSEADGSAVPADEEARFEAALSALNTTFGSYWVNLVQVSSPNAAVLQVTIAATSPAGDASQGVLGCTLAGQITLLTGWNWYTGSTPTAIASNQYDFQTIVTHELGHAIGLAHSGDSNSVMYPYLAAGITRSALTANDLAQLEASGTVPEPLTAAGFVSREGVGPRGTSGIVSRGQIIAAGIDAGYATPSDLPAAPSGPAEFANEGRVSVVEIATPGDNGTGATVLQATLVDLAAAGHHSSFAIGRESLPTGAGAFTIWEHQQRTRAVASPILASMQTGSGLSGRAVDAFFESETHTISGLSCLIARKHDGHGSLATPSGLEAGHDAGGFSGSAAEYSAAAVPFLFVLLAARWDRRSEDEREKVLLTRPRLAMR